MIYAPVRLCLAGALHWSVNLSPDTLYSSCLVQHGRGLIKRLVKKSEAVFAFCLLIWAENNILFINGNVFISA